VLHTLRGVVGDSVFFNALRSYQKKFKGQSAVTSELQAVVDSVAGTDLSWFFNQWIYGPGWPIYASKFTWTADSISLTIQQHQESSWQTFRMPIRVRAYYGANHQDYVVQDSLREQRFSLPLSVQPDSMVLDPDGWVLKQIVAPTSVGLDKRMPTEFLLGQNYPNPFNPTTTIEYQIPEIRGQRSAVSHVMLKVYDLLGKEVATLVDGVQESGLKTVQFDAGRLASGVYLYRLQAGGHVATKKLVVLR
jgi:aminopeptidase N